MTALASIFFVLDLSECLLQQIPHFCRRLLLHLVRSMGVGGEGETCAAEAQHTGHRFYIYAVLQGEGCEGVPQVVEADMLQPGILEDHPPHKTGKHPKI